MIEKNDRVGFIFPKHKIIKNLKTTCFYDGWNIVERERRDDPSSLTFLNQVV